jgi:hypothetical protein
MVTYKEKVSDEESCQVFVPFVSDVRVGGTPGLETESEDPPSLTSSYSHHQGTNPFLQPRGERLTPPSSPNISSLKPGQGLHDNSQELMELQLDYWTQGSAGNNKETGNGGKEKDSDKEKSKKQDSNSKSSIRTTFRSLAIVHLSTSPTLPQAQQSDTQHTFSMTYTTKEKKPKAVLKLGKKKEKSGESDSKLQNIDGITRLICLSKSSQPLRVSIDGAEWTGVKFFQLSSQWQTHIKHLPVAVATPPSPTDSI